MRNRVAKSVLSVAKIEEGISNNDDKRTITREITKGFWEGGQKSKRICGRIVEENRDHF